MPSQPRCFIAASNVERYEQMRSAARRAGFDVARTIDNLELGTARQDSSFFVPAIRASSIVIIDTENPGAHISEVSRIAQEVGRRVIGITRSRTEREFSDFPGLTQLTSYLDLEENSLSDVVFDLLSRLYSTAFLTEMPTEVNSRPLVVDLARLDKHEEDNLYFELLTQLGFRHVEWIQTIPSIDILAEWNRNDPDGFSYPETWFISLCRSFDSTWLDLLLHRPEQVLLDGVDADERRFRRVAANKSPLTVLFISTSDALSAELGERFRSFGRRRRYDGAPVRFRVWSSIQLTRLIQRFPQIGYKYFSEEARDGRSHRKSFEQLYLENAEMSNRQHVLLRALEDEKDRRIRAERDAAWKDISFAAAHKLGNPVFALETNLGPLRKRITEVRTAEAVQIIDEMAASIDKAKDIIDQFKSLARAEELQTEPTLLHPLIDGCCQTARALGIDVSVDCSAGAQALIDPLRIVECVDEILQNALEWFDKPTRVVCIAVRPALSDSLPAHLNTSGGYLVLSIKDNGCGVPAANKKRVFDAFFTTREHGTGLGLALVRKIIEAHQGVIQEVGSEGTGAHFEIFLPLASPSADTKQITKKKKAAK